MTGPVAEVSRRSVAPLLILVQVQAGSPIIVDAAHTTKAVSAHNWAPDLLFSEPSFRLSRGPKRSPSLNFARVRRAGVVEGLFCYLPMRFVSIGQPHVHHERISVVCAFDPNRARLWFQSHRDKSHFPKLSSAFPIPSTSYDRSRGLNRRQADSFRAASQSLPPAGPHQDSFSAVAGVRTASRARTHQRHQGAAARGFLAKRLGWSRRHASGE